MKEINVERIASEVKRLCIEAACDLPVDVEKLIVHAAQTEESDFGKYAMEKVCRNVKIARENEAAHVSGHRHGHRVRRDRPGRAHYRRSSGGRINKGVSEGYVDGTCASQP